MDALFSEPMNGCPMTSLVDKKIESFLFISPLSFGNLDLCSFSVTVTSFQALESELCSLVRDGNLHWRHKQMAIGMMLSIIVQGHVPSQEVVDIWLQVSLR